VAIISVERIMGPPTVITISANPTIIVSTPTVIRPTATISVIIARTVGTIMIRKPSVNNSVPNKLRPAGYLATCAFNSLGDGYEHGYDPRWDATEAEALPATIARLRKPLAGNSVLTKFAQSLIRKTKTKSSRSFAGRDLW